MSTAGAATAPSSYRGVETCGYGYPNRCRLVMYVLPSKFLLVRPWWQNLNKKCEAMPTTFLKRLR